MIEEEWSRLDDAVIAEMEEGKPWFHRLVHWLAWVDSRIARWLHG